MGQSIYADFITPFLYLSVSLSSHSKHTHTDIQTLSYLNKYRPDANSRSRAWLDPVPIDLGFDTYHGNINV